MTKFDPTARRSVRDASHYKLDGRRAVPCSDLVEWARWLETADCQVGETMIGPLRVSTVFLGVDHRFSGEGDPILFETMIFGMHERSEWTEGWGERACTWEAAEAAHQRGVDRAREVLEAAKASLE